MRPGPVFIGLGLVLLVLAALVGADSCRKHTGGQAEHQAAIHEGEANAHVSQAQAIPVHSQALAEAQADADRQRAEVRRLRRLLDAQTPGVPGPAVPDPAPTPGHVPDHRDELLVAQDAMIATQDRQIAALKAALTDEEKRAAEWRKAFEAERARAAAQEAATKAWKDAVTTSRWRGRGEGAGTVLILAKIAGVL